MKKNVNNFIKFIKNSYFFNNKIIVLLLICIISYLFIYRFYKVKENMERSPAYGVKLCLDNRCMPGCVKPRFLSNNCDSSIYKNPNGKCYMKCAYECQSPLDECQYDDCCIGCGKVKVEVPCIGFRNKEDLIPGLNINSDNIKINTTEIVYDNLPTGNIDKSTVKNSMIKSKTLDIMMNDLNRIYATNDGYKLRLPGNMLCSANITNTFTECGIPAANSSCS